MAALRFFDLALTEWPASGSANMVGRVALAGDVGELDRNDGDLRACPSGTPAPSRAAVRLSTVAYC